MGVDVVVLWGCGMHRTVGCSSVGCGVDESVWCGPVGCGMHGSVGCGHVGAWRHGSVGCGCGPMGFVRRTVDKVWGV